MSKKRGIILLDIDDTILPSVQTHAGVIHDNKIIFDLNIKRLKLLCEKFDLDIAILSDWSLHIKRVKLTIDGDARDDKFAYFGSSKNESALFNDLKDALFNRIVDSRENLSKESYIKKVIQEAKYEKVIIIDDSDFSQNVNYNNGSYYIKGCGFITNPMISVIKNIMVEKNYKGF